MAWRVGSRNGRGAHRVRRVIDAVFRIGTRQSRRRRAHARHLGTHSASHARTLHRCAVSSGFGGPDDSQLNKHHRLVSGSRRRR